MQCDINLFVPVTKSSSKICSQALTVVAGVNSLSQQEAAELVFSMYGVLDLHQVGCHAERVVLQVALTLLTTAGNEFKIKSDKCRLIQ